MTLRQTRDEEEKNGKLNTRAEKNAGRTKHRVKKQMQPRIVVSFSTVPARLVALNKFCEELKVNVRPFCDEIYAFLPTISRDGVPYDVTDSHKVTMKNCGITYVKIEKDFGPISKLAPVLHLEEEPSTVCLTVDDDLLVRSCLIEQLLKKAEEHPDASFSSCGWITGPAPPFTVQQVTEPAEDTLVDVVEGCGVNVFRRGHFGSLQQLLDFIDAHPEIGTGHDDHLVSAYLAEQKVPRMVVAINRFSCMSFLHSRGDVIPGISDADGFFREVVILMRALCRSGHYGQVDYKLRESFFVAALFGVVFLILSAVSWQSGRVALSGLFFVVALISTSNLWLTAYHFYAMFGDGPGLVES